MRNPFAHHATDAAHMQREIREAYAHDGWGTTVARNVPRSGDEPLVFQLQLPDDQRLVEMSELADGAQATGETPAWVGDWLLALTAAAHAPGVILVGAIVMAANPADVIASITVLASENVEPLDLPKDSRTADGGEVVFHGTFTDKLYGHMDDIGLAYRHPDGSLLPPMILRHFVTEQAAGKVGVTFASSHDGIGGEQGRDYMRQIVKSVWYGPPDAPE